jgi:CheY-like chemotaxis protein
MLAFSRKQPLRPRPTNINDLVAAIGKMMRRTLGEQIEIDSVLADELWTVDIDRAQLETALVNLCLNARDAMPAGGRLLIETGNVMLDEARIGSDLDVPAGPYVLLKVSDTGRGILPKDVDHVFEPFFTTKEDGKGPGLGLSMVYGFVKQSNGHIAVDSAVDRGTSFRLYLPRIVGNAEETAVRNAKPMAGGAERILVVEDDPQVRASVVAQLRSLGYAVSEAADGDAGLVAFGLASPPCDLLLTDVVMPGALNGKALADAVARRWPKTRIVFMSGYTDDILISDGRLDAEVLLLSKPFRKADLALIVRRALDGSAIRIET